MKEVPQWPVGFARRTVAALKPGEAINVRPDYIAEVDAAAADLGISVVHFCVSVRGASVIRVRRNVSTATVHGAKNGPARPTCSGRSVARAA